MNLWRIENDQAKLSLHPGQAQTWRSEKRFTFLIAGTQSGKTSFGPWWLWREIQRCGKGDYLAVTASFDLFKLKMLPELRTVFEQILGIGRWWAGDKVMELRKLEMNGNGLGRGPFLAKRADDPMWGRIILRSAQSKGGLEAATAKAAWLDECGQDSFTLEDWEAVQRRLSLSQGRVLGTTTPYNLGWLKTEVYEPAMAGDDEDIEIVNFPSTLNPAFPPAEYDRQRRKMQAWRFGMFYDGIFTRPAGMIYACWNDKYLIDPFPIPDDWPRGVGVDFGGANNAILWAAEDPETSIWYIYDEWLGGGTTSKAYADKLKEKVPEDAKLSAWGGGGSEGQQRRDWGGVSEPPLSGNVEAQIDRGIELIEEGRLRVFRTCKGFRDEMGSYKRKLDEKGDPTDEIEHKRKFHRMDAYRYMASGIIQPQGILFRVLDV